MSLIDQLKELSELHQAGQLTDQEFSDAKRCLIQESPAEPPPPLKEASAAEVPTRSDEKEKTFQSSRWSAGNVFFPDTLTLAGDAMLFRKRSMFGSREEHINYQAVASFRVKHGLLLSTCCIETSGGSQPIFISGLWRSEAKEIQDRIRAHQKIRDPRARTA